MVNSKRLIDILGFRGRISALGSLKRGFEQVGNAAEADLSTDKSCNSHFVRGVEDGRSRPPGLKRAAAQRQRRKASAVARFIYKRADLGQIELRRRPVDANRPSQAMSDWNAHV